MYKSIRKFKKPREILKYNDSVVCEMTDVQLDFLCGMIRKHQPHKLIEVGVAEGGTSAVVLNCLQMECPDCEMYSVDLNENLYRNDNYKTGYVLSDLSSYLRNLDKHHLLTGGILPEFIYEIGSDIDFVILDTVHRLPGEILDFLCVLPFLSENAVVVLHDITMGTSYSRGTNDAISNNPRSFINETISDDVYNIIKKEKKSAIMVTHDIAEAVSMSDKVIVLTNRPSKIKNIYEIKLDNKKSPISNRKDPKFNYYSDNF